MIVPNSQRYIDGVRRWIRMLLREPNILLSGSIGFYLSCLPILTFGPAQLALVFYVSRNERGVKTGLRDSMIFGFKTCARKGFLMGFSDLGALLMAGGCYLGMVETGLPLPMKYAYAVFMMADALYLLSGMYRYPALAAQPEGAMGAIMARGFLMVMNNLGWTLLFACLQLLLLIICAATGVGLVFVYPAAAALIGACAYAEMLKKYMPDEENN